MKSCRLIAGLLCLGSLALPAKAAGETAMMELAGDLTVNRYGEAVDNIPLRLQLAQQSSALRLSGERLLIAQPQDAP